MNKQVFFIISIIVVLSAVSTNKPPSRLLFDLIETKPIKEQFKLWHYTIRRPYDINSEEGLKRYKIFKYNIKSIKSHNEKNEGWTQGLGPFTDMTWEEFESTRLGFKMPDEKDLNIDYTSIDNLKKELEASGKDLTQIRDWSYLYGYVKDQYECGSCWAFSAIGTIEGLNRLHNNDSTRFSEQHFVDCENGSDGCEGGFLHTAMEFAESQGVIKENDYPLKAVYKYYRKDCRSYGKRPYLKISNVISCHSSWSRTCSIYDMIALLQNGPYNASMEVRDGLQHYKQGDWLPRYCKESNHAVVVVQITSHNVKIRNSWGPTWGTSGYATVSLSVPANGPRMVACGLLQMGYNTKTLKRT